MSKRILLVQLADIGDMILTTPALAALREARPDAHLTLFASSHTIPVIEQGMVDEFITVKRRGFNQSLGLLNPETIRQFLSLRHGNYDTVVFFHRFTLKLGTVKFWLIAKFSGAKRILGVQNGNAPFLTEAIPDEGFSAKHHALYWLELVRLLGASDELRRAQVAFDTGVLPLAVHRGTRVIIHAGGGDYSLARRWFPQRFAEVADALVEEFDAQIILIGTESDDAAAVANAMQAEAINLTGKTTLTQLADVIRSADLYIGTDSGMLHLAAAVRTPLVAIFGLTNPEAWGPWSPSGKVALIRTAPLCAPCNFVGHEIGLRTGCEARTCIKTVQTQEVLIAARSLIRDEARPLNLPMRQQRDWQKTVQILGLPIDNINYEEWLTLIDKWVKYGTRLHQVCTVNPEFVVMAQSDFLFRTILKRADLCVPDGAGLLWAANLLKTPLQERVTGSDGIYRIAEEASKRHWKIFLLGAAEGVAEYAAYLLTEKYWGLQIVGHYSGSPSPDEEDAIVERVNASRADILLVAYGAPKQDKWIARNSARLNVKMAMGIGGSLDFVTGRIERAPEWMREYHLEWLYRLYKEPWRFWRMLRLPRFVMLVILRGAK